MTGVVGGQSRDVALPIEDIAALPRRLGMAECVGAWQEVGGRMGGHAATGWIRPVHTNVPPWSSPTTGLADPWVVGSPWAEATA